MSYFPSKKFIAILASLFFIIGGGYFVLRIARSTYHVAREEKSNNQSVAQNSEAALFAAKDTDGDGLKDWEEVLWHTDSNNVDTDGDGAKDNDEVLARRDPARAGPSDSIDILAKKIDDAESPTGKERQEERPNTLTEQLARDFGEAYVRQKFGKKEVDGEYLSKLLSSNLTENLTDSLTKTNIQEPQEIFIKKDFAVIVDSSSAAIHDYLNRLGELFMSVPNNGDPALSTQNELQFALKAIKEQRLGDLKKLLAARDAYQKFANGLKTMPVPALMAKSHQSMANSFWRLSLIVEQMSRFEEDPVASFTAFNAYLIEARRSIGPLTAIVEQIKARNLIFKENEGGALFNRYASLPWP